jgi:soluble lytic murein transglycosylase-like protein
MPRHMIDIIRHILVIARHTDVINPRDRGRKEGAVSRKTPVFSGILTCALMSVAAPSAAWADVMEISGTGFAWVAGAPASARGANVDPMALPLDAASVEADLAGLGLSPAGAKLVAADVGGDVAGLTHAAASFTAVADAAGPTQWRAKVAQLAAKYDISPTLLEAVVWQESRWNTQARSPVGARGLAQLMPGTARQMGVNPDDPHANLEGGARYLRLQLDAFGGNVEKALAAYNAGPARVLRAGGIPAIRETQNYVASIMSRLSAPVRR